MLFRSDRALNTFAGLLRTSFRGSDLIARLGGDEFAVLLIDSAADGMAEPVNRFRQRLAEQGGHDGPPYELRCSIGFAAYAPGSEPDLTALLVEADRQMYAEKGNRR